MTSVGWTRRRWVRAGAAAALVALAAAAAVPLLVPIDRFRPLIVQALETATGRTVRLGALRLYVFPTLHIHAANLRLRNPAGFPAGDAVAVDAIDLKVALAPLLSRRIEITGVALNGVRVVYLTGAGGRTNLDLPGPRSTRSGAAGGAGGGTLFALGRIGRVSVAHLSLVSAALDRRGRVVQGLSLRGVGVRVQALDAGAPNWLRQVDAVVNLKGAALDVSGLSKPLVFTSGAIRVASGAAKGAFAASLDTVRATGTVAVNAFDPSSAAFTLVVPDLDLGRLQRLMGRGGAAAAPSPGPRRLLARGEVTVGRMTFASFEARHVVGRVSVYSDTVRLDAYALSAYGGEVRGAASVDYAAAGAPAVVTARARGVDLARAAAALGVRGGIAGVADADLRLTTALGRDPERALAGGGTVTVERLAAPPLTATRVRGTLRVAGGRLRLDPYSLSAYGGTARGAAVLNYGEPRFPVTATLEARGVDVAALVAAVAPGPPRITGTLGAAFSLATLLGRDPIASLVANGTFAVRDGAFPGLDLGGRLGGLAKVAQALRAGAPGGATAFRYFGGDLRIARERGYSNALRLDASQLSGTAHGSFGFDRTLDYAGTGVLSGEASGGSPLGLAVSLAGKGLGQMLPGAAGATGARVPFRLQGTFDDPKFSLAGAPELLRSQPQPGSPPAQPPLPQLPGLPPNVLPLFH